MMRNLKNNNVLVGKLRAGALQYTIAFSLLIILILVSFLLFNHLRSVELSQYQVYDNLKRDINSARLVLEEQPGLFAKSQKEIILSEEGFHTNVGVELSQWGFFYCANIEANHRNLKRKKLYLYSDDIQLNKLKPSLYLSDSRKHLSVSGKAYLGNNTFLPGYGIRTTYINGLKYQRDSLVHGASYKSAPKLPELRGKWRTIYGDLLNGISGEDSSIYWGNIKADSIVNSFSKKRLILHCPPGTIVDKKYISGNIVLVGSDIEIKNTSVLESCIVLAESISIESKFSGSAQFIAEKTINLGQKSVLSYPSILYCKADKKGEGIVLEVGCQVEGEIIVCSSQKSLELLKTGKDSKIFGQVYCNGLVTFHGTLLGSMYCKGFIDRTREGVYSNYIYDVCIDFDRLPKEYGGVSLITNENGKKCIQELI